VLFTLEALPAEEGDCLLLHWGTRKGKTKNEKKLPRIALIDGGPGLVYDNDLKPRLDALVENLEVDQLELELVMISHMDSDHIVGIKKLFSVLKKQVDNNAPQDDRTIRAKRLWLNVFNDVLGDAIDKYYQTLPKGLQASVDGKPSPDLVKRLEEKFADKDGDEDEAIFHAQSVAAVLAGHGDGRTLRDDHRFLFEKQLTATLNAPLTAGGGKATLITQEKTPEAKIEGLKFTIAGPSMKEIEALQKEFDEYIEKNGLTAEAVLAAYADESVKNLSSIVCLAEFEKKTILLTGDARGDLIIDGLIARKLLKDKKATLKVDILKVPHHGSDNNVEDAFFTTIVADTYVLSGDGVNGNPERATLEMITKARGKKAKFDLVLTYDIDHIDANRKKDFETKQKRKKPANRRKWDDKTMSLETFFAEKKAEKFSFTLLTGARKIDLGDEKVDY
jgi:beta-lactamase superfamily II metal-dependent hydrolase